MGLLMRGIIIVGTDGALPYSYASTSRTVRREALRAGM